MFHVLIVALSAFFLLCAPAFGGPPSPPGGPPALIADAVRQDLLTAESIPVLIKLRRPGEDPRQERMTTDPSPDRFISRDEIRGLQRAFEDSFTPTERASEVRIGHRLENIPWLSARISGKALRKIEHSPWVAMVLPDEPVQALLGESGPLVQRDIAHSAGLTGSGVSVAVLDTGIDRTHPYLSDDVVHEECFQQIEGGCPLTGTGRASGPGSAADGYGHGTHVSGIITSGVAPYTGLAPDAGIVALKVLSDTGNGWDSDILAAIDWARTNRDLYDIRVINMSLGGGAYTSICDGALPSYANAANMASAAGITLFAASGNSGYPRASYPPMITAPGCIASIISVGSVYDANVGAKTWYGVHSPICTDAQTAPDKIVCSSNAASFLDLLGPGAMIWSSWPNEQIAETGGTSMATPHAAGVAALLYQRNPNITPNNVKAALTSTGTMVFDSRVGQSFPRINALDALDSLDVDADLLVSVTDSPDPVTAGTNLVYTATVLNNGPTDATGISFNALLDANTAFLTVVSTQGSCSQDNGTVTCLLGNIANQDSANVAITVVAPAFPVPVSVTAGVSGSESDPAPLNNDTSSQTSVVTNLGVTIVGSGSVTGTGIACPSDCAESFQSPQTVSLTATSDPGWAFLEWTGSISESLNPASVDMISNQTVIANFASDTDGDGIANVLDNCPDHGNPGQTDSDLDDIGDLCDMFIAVAKGPGSGNDSQVVILDGNFVSRNSFLGFDGGESRYGARITTADMDGDGLDESVVAAGPEPLSGLEVKIFHPDGTPYSGGNLISFPTTFASGVRLAAADFDGDGRDEVVLGGANGKPYLRTVYYDPLDQTLKDASLLLQPFDGQVREIHVAAADLDLDGTPELLTSPEGKGITPRVDVWTVNLTPGKAQWTLEPYGGSFPVPGNPLSGSNQGASLAAGEGMIVMGTGANGGALEVYTSTGSCQTDPADLALPPPNTGYRQQTGIELSVGSVDGDVTPEILVTDGGHGENDSLLKVFNADCSFTTEFGPVFDPGVLSGALSTLGNTP